MRYIKDRRPKICFAKAGDVVRITFDGTDYGALNPAPFLVCVNSGISGAKGKRCQVQKNAMAGLYSDERNHFLVNLETGEACAMPHLSSRCEIVRNLAMIETEEE